MFLKENISENIISKSILQEKFNRSIFYSRSVSSNLSNMFISRAKIDIIIDSRRMIENFRWCLVKFWFTCI